jgi:hypothetical protein
MSYRDLREWLEQVESLGGVAAYRGADWDLEIGAIISHPNTYPDTVLGEWRAFSQEIQTQSGKHRH